MGWPLESYHGAVIMPDGRISIGASLMDTIDDLINEGHIEPQLAMKILGHFDRIVQEVLADRVKARLTFKVCFTHLIGMLWRKAIKRPTIGRGEGE